MTNKKSDRQFREELMEINPSIKPIEQYVNAKTNILVQCSTCGYRWKVRPSHLLKGHGCVKCAQKKAGLSSIKRAIENGKNLSQYSQLVEEWDYIKNYPLTPSDIAVGSNKEYWWKCKNGHSFVAKVCNRTHRSDGCPYCSHHKPIVGETDLKTTHPELCNEWNYEKNKDKIPELYMAKSGERVYWKCMLGHEWIASIESRTRGNGCPICSKRFRTSFPEQSIYFYLKKAFPDAISGYQNRETHISEIDVYIPSIKTGVEYDGRNWHSLPTAEKREQKKYNTCKNQGIRLIRVREDSSRTSACDDVVFTTYTDVEHSGNLNSCIVQLLCLLGINEIDIDVARDRFQIEASYYSVISEKSIAHRFPSLVNDWDYEKNGTITPQMVCSGTAQKYWWKCSNCGESYEMSPASRARGYSCQKCGNIKKAMSHHNNWENSHPGIAVTHPDLLEEWDYSKNDKINPLKITKGNQTVVWWKCKMCGHSWQASVDNRSKGRGCPQCRISQIGRKIQRAAIQKSGSLLQSHPDLCMEWDYEKNGDITPDGLPCGSGYKAFWICSTCGQEYSARVADRTMKNRGCPICGKRKAALAHSKTVANGRKILCVENGNVYSSMKEAAEAIGQKRSTCISNCLHGKQKTAGGFRWIYLNED